MMVSNQKVKALLFTLILAFIAIGTITVAAVMKNEKPVEVDSGIIATYFFEYQGSPGNEHDRNLWLHVPNDDNACNGLNDGCLIEVSESFTQTNPITGEVTLTQDVPVTSGPHANPIEGEMVIHAKNKN